PSGSLVQSIAMPTTTSAPNFALTAAGNSTSEGFMHLTTDGQAVLIPGYSANSGTAAVAGTASATTPRVVGILHLDGTVDTTTGPPDWSPAGNPRGVTGTDATHFWVSGSVGGARSATYGSTTSTQLSTTVTNLRDIEISSGQLYVSDASGTA